MSGVVGVSARFRIVVMTVVVALLLSVGIGVASPASATVPVSGEVQSGLTVTSTGATVLAGGDGRVSVTAQNPDGVDLYNASGVIVLPVGVTYVSGSALPGAPNAIGEPTVLTWIPDPATPTVTAQALVWENIADLPVGAQTTFSFAVTADPELYLVGETFDVGIGVYANSDERTVPTVTVPDAGGAPEVTDATEGASADSTLTVVALEIEKAETANPEGEVYRGPGNPATFAVTVRTADAAGSDDVVVTDLIPATFIFDRFTSAPCTVTPAACTAETVVIDGAVFTKLTWVVGDLDPAGSLTLTYDAHVGERQIAADGTATGPSTRPAGKGTAVKNTASASASYQGDVSEGGSTDVSVEAEATVTVLDLGIVKTGPAEVFSAGEQGIYRLDVRTSDYVDTVGTTITDVVPDGLCPVIPTGVPTPEGWPADCVTGGTVQSDGITLTAVSFDTTTGRSTVTFTVADRAPDQDAWIEYPVVMRSAYQGGPPTGTGDTFTNVADVTGTTVPAEGTTVDTGEVVAENGSSATLDTGLVSLSKAVSANTARAKITGVSGDGNTCANRTDYSSTAVDASPAYQLGDLICFRIESDFPTGVATRDVIVTDFVPSGTALVDWAAGPGSTLSADAGTISQIGTSTRWRLGAQVGGTGPFYVAADSTLVLDVLVRVTSVPKSTPRVSGNLAKLRYRSGDGSVVALRDDVDFRLAPPPAMTLDKSNGGAEPRIVREGDVVPFTLTVAHSGAAATLNDYPLATVRVEDVLPAGFDCATVDNAVPALSGCEERDGARVLIWNLGADELGDGLVPGTPITITYGLTVPSPLSIDSSHTNTAAVTRFTAVTTDGITPGATGSTFYPTNPVGAFPDQTKNAAEASDRSTIALANAAVAKRVVSTSVDESNNSALTQATIGETVVWSYSAKIPAGTSVFNGTLSDGLPVPARLAVDASAVSATLPDGAVLIDGCGERDATAFRLCADPADSQFGSLIFPAVWTNQTTEAQTVTVEMVTRIADVDANAHGSAITNTATLTSTATAADSGAITRATSSAQVEVVVPAPALDKNVATSATGPWTSTTQPVSGGQTVYYRLNASNAAGRPPIHDAVVIDCVDRGVTIGTLPADMTGPEFGDGLNGCALGTQKLTWTLSAPVIAGTPQSVVYPVTLPTSAVSGVAYVNRAKLTGSTLEGAVDGERVVTSNEPSNTVTVVSPTITKVADRLSPNNIYVPGETVTWTATTTLQPDTTLYNMAVTDTLPSVFPADAGSRVTITGCQPAALCDNSRSLSPSGRTFGVFFGDIAASTSTRTVTLTFSVVIPNTATNQQDNNVSYTNRAVVRWDRIDRTEQSSVLGNWNEAVQSGLSPIVVRRPAVVVTKQVSDAAVPKAQGDIFAYTVGARAAAGTNDVTAYNVSVVDKVPAGVVPVVSATDGTPVADGASVAGGVWNATARTITWTIATLERGAAETTFRYNAKLDLASTLSGPALQNTVTPQSWQSLETDGAGKTYGPGTAATATVQPAFPKVETAKTQLSPTNPVYIGDEIAYRIVLSNPTRPAPQPPTATAFTVGAEDTLPAGWTYQSGSSKLGGVAIDDPEVSGQKLAWDALGSIAPAGQLVLTYIAVPGASVAVGSSVAHTNTAVATGVTDATGGDRYAGGSYIGANSTATARIDEADLEITKSAGEFVAGQTGSFEVTVRNIGPDPSVGVVVREDLDLPEGATFVSATGAGWACGVPADDGTFTCARSDAAAAVPSGVTLPVITVMVAVAADVASGTAVPNTATVGARTADTVTENNTATATGEVTTEADLGVEKTVLTPADGAVTAGRQIEWQVTLTNNGPSLSRGSDDAPIVLTDTLPAGVSGLAISGTAPEGCAISGGTLTCTITRDLAVGDTIVVTVAGVVDSDVEAGAAVISNTASVTPVTTDPDPGNNSSTTETDVAVEERLTITKRITAPVPPELVIPGEQITYTLDVRNGGPSDARGVYIDDVLPGALRFDTLVSGDGWTATAGAGTVRFAYDGVLPADTSAPTITYRATLDPAFVGEADELTNTATVSSTWRSDQDTSQATPGVPEAEADLALTKDVRPEGGTEGDAVIAGRNAVYSFSVDNLGPSDADAVTVTDVLPIGMSVVTLPDECSVAADGRTVTCVLAGGLDAAADPWTFEITVAVAPSVTSATLVNDALVSSTTDDPNTENNDAKAILPVETLAKLSVSKTPDVDSVNAGDQVSWTITVANAGPSDAQSVSLADALPADLVLVSASFGPDQTSCSGTQAVRCDLGVIAAGGSVDVDVVTTVRASVPDGSRIVNTATATSTTRDVDTGEPATATDSGAVDVVAVSALTIDKTTSTPVVRAGETATFTIKVGGSGPSDAAASVVVTDTLPEGLTYLSSSTTGGPAVWSCESADGRQVLCELQDAAGEPVSLAADTSAPDLVIVAAVSPTLAAQVVTNVATVTSPSAPEDPQDQVDVEIQTVADLGITKTNLGAPTAGEEFVWEIVVTNHGPSDSVATPEDPILITDQLPAEVSFVSATGAGAECRAEDRDVTCAIADTMAPGDTVTVRLRVAVDQAASGALTNTATVVPSLTEEPAEDPENPSFPNTATNVTPPVIEVADLGIVKSVTSPADGPVLAGSEVVWRLDVTNHGPSNSDADVENPITVVDTLPPGVLATRVDAPEGWTCTISDDKGTVTCTLPENLARDDVQSIGIVGAVDPGRQGRIDNVATVAPGLTGQGANTHPDRDTATSIISESADLRIDKEISATIVAGGTGRYTMDVTNDGPSSARGVTVTDTLPAPIGFSKVVTPDGEDALWTCVPDDGDAQIVICTYDGILEPGNTIRLEIEVTAPSDLTGDITNVARVDAITDDPNPGNNEDTVSGTTATQADLEVIKSHDPDAQAIAGRDLTWTVTVNNLGESDSRASSEQPIVVTDQLAAGTTFLADGSDPACAADAADPQLVVCTITQTLAAQTSVSFDIRVALDEALEGTIANAATATPEITTDPNPDNNTGRDEVTLVEVADLQIEKALVTEPSAVIAGQTVTWSLIATNLGPSNSDADAETPITVVDTLPDGVRATSVTGPAGWACAIAEDERAVTCTLPSDLPTASPQTFTVSGVIDPSRQGEIENVAVVTPGLTPQPEENVGPDRAVVKTPVTESADLKLVKSISGEIVAGSTGRYLLQVSNLGPSTARGVTITDTLPTPLAFARVVVPEGVDAPWTCASTPGTQEVECAYDGAILPSGIVDLEIEVSAPADLSGDLINTATVRAQTPDPDLENNTSTVGGTTVTTADLVLRKTHDAGATAVAGAPFTWTLTVTNDGPSDSVADADRPIVVTDRLTDGTGFLAAGSSELCAVDADDPQLVVCTIPQTIAAQASVTLPVQVSLDAALTGELANTADVAPGATADPDLRNNVATDTVTLAQVADLSVAKTVTTAPGDIVAGREISWTVQVANAGPSTSYADADEPIVVADILPAGVSFVSASGDGWSCAPGAAGGDGRAMVDCARAGDLPVGAAPVITVVGLIASDVQGEVRNDVTVAPGKTPDPDASNNAAQATSVVSTSADLTLSKAISQEIQAGGSGQYTFTVTNLGPSTARDIAVVDTLPARLSFASAAGTGWTCAAAGGSAVDCTFDGTLAPSGSLTFTIDVSADAALQGDIVNTAVVSASTPDPDPGNNTGTATGTIAEVADLSIVKTPVGKPIVGETFAYELAVGNAGPATSRGIRVEDALPAGLAFVGATGDGWSCGADAATGTVACVLPELAAGAQAPVITVEVRVLPAGYPEVANTATVTATTPEDPGTLEDNTSTATVTVPPLADLAITKTLVGDLVTAAQGHYRITVVNNGPTEDPGPITVTDPLPAGIVANSATLSGADGTCSISDGTLGCVVDGLAVGQTATVDLTVDVQSSARGTIVNVASASSNAFGKTVEATATGIVIVVDLPATGGVLGPYLPWGLGLLALGLLTLWWSRRRREEDAR